MKKVFVLILFLFVAKDNYTEYKKKSCNLLVYAADFVDVKINLTRREEIQHAD